MAAVPKNYAHVLKKKSFTPVDTLLTWLQHLEATGECYLEANAVGCPYFAKSYKIKKLPLWDFELGQMDSKKSKNLKLYAC